VGTRNHGLQDITIAYYEEATSYDVNKRNVDIIPRGIYSGARLTKVSNTEVTLSPFTLEIGDDDIQISSKSSTSATLNSSTLDSGDIDTSTPYLVFRWSYAAQQNNYVEVHAISSLSAAQDNDIIIGKCVFSGSELTGFDYSDRTLLAVMDRFLRVEADSGLYVWVEGGRIQTPAGYMVVPAQRVGPFSVPSSPNSRIDLVYVKPDGTIGIVQGSAAISPSPPAYGGKLVLAQVLIVNGDTSISSNRITDVRSFNAPAIKSNHYLSTYNSDTQLVATGAFTKADLGSIKNQSGISITNNRITLTADRKYALSYFVEALPTSTSSGDPSVQAKWVVVSGDSTWNLENISFAATECAEDHRVLTSISSTCYIIPSTDTVIELQIYTEKSSQKAEIRRVITNI